MRMQPTPRQGNGSRRSLNAGRPVNRTIFGVLAVGACLLAALVAAPATVLAGGSGTLSFSPASTTTSTGSTFTVTTVARASVTISGAETPVTFDRTRLRVTAIAKAGPWTADGATYIGFPTAANMATAIAAYNDTGRVSSYPAVAGGIAVFFIDGISNEPANTDVPVLAVTFEAIACGTSTLGIPLVQPFEGVILDGRPPMPSDGYGFAADVTSVSGSVVNDCHDSTPTPTPGLTPTPTPITNPTPTPTPAQSPNPSATAVTGTTHVIGTLADSFLSLTVPASASIPLEWDVINRAALIVQIDTNRSWSLDVTDPNTGPDRGHMRSGTSHLGAPMTVDAYSRTISLETGGTLSSGRSTRSSGFSVVFVDLQQSIADSDEPGSYGISLVFHAMTTF